MDKKTKQTVQEEQQVLYIFREVIEAFPQYSLSQHLCHILRKKNEKNQSYDWNNTLLLKKFEEYYDELKNELSLEYQNKD